MDQLNAYYHNPAGINPLWLRCGLNVLIKRVEWAIEAEEETAELLAIKEGIGWIVDGVWDNLETTSQFGDDAKLTADF